MLYFLLCVMNYNKSELKKLMNCRILIILLIRELKTHHETFDVIEFTNVYYIQIRPTSLRAAGLKDGHV